MDMKGFYVQSVKQIMLFKLEKFVYRVKEQMLEVAMVYQWQLQSVLVYLLRLLYPCTLLLLAGLINLNEWIRY